MINKQQKFYSLPKRYKQIRELVPTKKGLCLKRRICLYRLGSV